MSPHLRLVPQPRSIKRCDHTFRRRADLDQATNCVFECAACGEFGWRRFNEPDAMIRSYSRTSVETHEARRLHEWERARDRREREDAGYHRGGTKRVKGGE